MKSEKEIRQIFDKKYQHLGALFATELARDAFFHGYRECELQHEISREAIK